MGVTQQSDRGVLTVAFGSQRYIEMAKMLALSVRRFNPGLPCAVVTDSDDAELAELFPIRIPYRREQGGGMWYKVHLDQYTPFKETIYIDSDSLVVGDLNRFWDFYASVPFGVIGFQIHDGFWFMDVAQVLAQQGLSEMPRFNGGLYYFKMPEAVPIFEAARDIMHNYDAYGMKQIFRGSINDEPVVGLALAKHGVRALKDHGQVMRTLLDLTGPLQMDVLKGGARFYKRRDGMVSPAVVHFCGIFSKTFYYRRECMKLRMAQSKSWSPGMISLLLNTASFAPCRVDDARTLAFNLARSTRDWLRNRDVKVQRTRTVS